MISKKYIEENAGQYPVYSSQTLNNGEIGKINSFDFDCETVTWTTDGVHAGTVFYRKGKFSITNVCGMIIIRDTTQLNYQFLFFWLSIETKKHVNPSIGNAKVMNYQMEKILIPIPPLAVQEKIVRILNTLSMLEEELKTELLAELEVRWRQYRYYRNKLLTFGEEVQRKPLGEVSKVIRGKRVTRRELVKEGAFPVVSGGRGYMGALDRYNREAGTITIAQYGTAGIVAWQEQRFWANDVCYSILPAPTQLNNKFLYHLLANKQEYIYSRVNRATYPPTLSRKELLGIECPLPPLALQQQIVDFLDKFYTLVHALEEELRAEQTLRHRQHLYCCKRLLNFPK